MDAPENAVEDGDRAVRSIESQPVATHYDVLGVSSEASDEDVRYAFEEVAATLDPNRQSHSPPETRARAQEALRIVNESWAILGDPDERRRYDGALASSASEASLARSGAAAGAPDRSPPERWPPTIETGQFRLDAALAGLEAGAAWLAPSRRLSRKVVVPDLRGLPAGEARYLAVKAGLHVRIIQLATRPLPVEGRVLNQQPVPGASVVRDSQIVLDVVHPEVPRW